mmetsp:Transcript_27051/g.49735  ORF Transcript_27051/g.49735 Transcript_27051/m.49735 type:complete len:187 (+) Transcript_27051:71-631(+)
MAMSMPPASMGSMAPGGRPMASVSMPMGGQPMGSMSGGMPLGSMSGGMPLGSSYQPGTTMGTMGPPPTSMAGRPPMASVSMPFGGGSSFQPGMTMGGGSYKPPGPPTSMGPQGPQGPPMSGQYMPNISRPNMTGVQNPPVVAGNIQYGPSYSMQYQKRSTADKTAVKYTGFLPLEGVYEEDTCRIG